MPKPANPYLLKKLPKLRGRDRLTAVDLFSGAGGITLGLTEESPFVREGSVPVGIQVLDDAVAQQPLSAEHDLRLEVDRGGATYRDGLTRDQSAAMPPPSSNSPS